MTAASYQLPQFAGLVQSFAVSQEAHQVCASIERVFTAKTTAGSAGAQAVAELTDIFLDARIDGWDGYDGLPVAAAAYVQTERFLKSVLDKYPSPTAGATPSGSLTLEWIDEKDRRLIVAFGGEERLAYAAIFGSESVHGTVLFIRDIPLEITRHLDRIFFRST